ncbi:hypothetical protein PG989_016382 [Apiospora arundinis]
MSLLSDSAFQFPWLADDEHGPLCAALSRYWGSGEITYDDLQSNSGCVLVHGSSDPMDACLDALDSRKLDWLWADTICADRSSSAVVAESLGYMYRWYHNCAVCLNYLDDICAAESSEEMLVKPSWLSRSWSLIELIAPQRLSLPNANWSLIEATSSLASALSRTTNLDHTILENEETLNEMSIGEQMSWVDQFSNRRVEEATQSLFGIFGVSMQVIHGEEERIVMNLQEELRKKLDNASQFIWRVSDTQQLRHFFTRSPPEFGYFRPPDMEIKLWRLPTTLQLSSTIAPPITTSALDELDEDLCTLHSDTPDNSHCYGGLSIRLREWQEGLVRFASQQLFDISINGPSGVSNDTVARDVDASSSDPTIQFVTNVSQPDCSSIQETQPERTEQVCLPCGELPCGISIHQDHSPEFTTENQEAYKSTSDCGASSMGSTLEDDGSDGSDETDDYEDCLFSSSVCDDEPGELDTVFSGLKDALAQTALDRFPSWLANTLEFYETPQHIDTRPNNKRIKNDDFSSHTKVGSPGRLAEEDDLTAGGTPGSRRFACPFFLQGRTQHTQCLTRTDLHTIRDLKQHLCLNHRQPYYCPTCGTTFPRASARDDHIKSRTCSLQEWKGAPQGLSQYQIQRLTKRCTPGTSEMNQWYDIWNLIYSEEGVAPPQEEPLTPYLTGVLESAVCLVRDFWTQKGRLIIADFLEQRDLRGYEVRDEERNLAALYQTILNNVVDLVVRIVRDGDSHLEPSNAIRNMLSTIRKLCPRTM